MQERFVLLEGVPAGGLGAAQACLQSALGAWRPAPSLRGTAQSGVGTATPGCLSDPLCHRLLPLPRGTFSEINGHVESVFVRLYRFYTNETIESRAKDSRRAVRESGGGVCGLRRGASHRIAVPLSRLPTAARNGCHGSSHAAT
jgi:hypothetical protein